MESEKGTSQLNKCDCCVKEGTRSVAAHCMSSSQGRILASDAIFEDLLLTPSSSFTFCLEHQGGSECQALFVWNYLLSSSAEVEQIY